MRYLLREEYGLRSYIGVPFCHCTKGEVYVQKLTEQEFSYLLVCDGEQDLPHPPTERTKKMVRPASQGETLSAWQRHLTCDNRYFPEVIWMITGKCNYNCRHCFNAADLAPLASEWSLEEAGIFLDEAQKCGVNAFTLTGGEPMLHPHFTDIMRGIYERGMFVHELNTNGSFITPQILDVFAETGARPLMKISFDGLGWHDWLRSCKGAEERTLAAVRLCLEEGLPVKVQFNVHRKNAGSVMETMRMLEDMGVQNVRIIRTSESPRWEECGEGQTLSFREYFECMLDFFTEWLKTPHRMAVTAWLMETRPPLRAAYGSRKEYPELSGFEKLKLFRPESYVCPNTRFLAAVTAEGDLVPCLQMSGYFSRKGVRLGNVKGGGLQEKLKEGRYLDTVCQTAGDLIRENPDCADCPHFTDCQGGCRAIALLTSGTYMGTDRARCIYYKEGYAERMDELVRNTLK